ncbi:hypothetical protein [Streptomyces sp. SGAir0957]
MTIDQTETPQTPPRELLDTLLGRWQEVADAYQAKTDSPFDDLTRQYSDYRLIYLRNIRDLKHVLDTGRMPCSLMGDEERRCGDCGRIHEDAYDKHGQPAPEAASGPWAPIHPAEQRIRAMERVIVGHLAEALIDSKNEEVRTWARAIAYELRLAGADLHDAIGNRLQELALGRPENEVPF